MQCKGACRVRGGEWVTVLNKVVDVGLLRGGHLSH